MDDPHRPTTEAPAAPPRKEKRPYQKPGFIRSLAFERASLACAGVKNTAGFPVGNCTMQS